MKRLLMVPLAMLLLALPLAAEGTKEKSVEEMGPVELEILNWGGWPSNVFGKAIEVYQERHPNVTMTQTSVPFANVQEQLLIRVSAADPPDITWIIEAWAIALADQGALIALDPYMEKAGWDMDDPGYGKFYPFVVDPFKNKGKLYAMPGSVNPFATGYNREMFLDAGLQPPIEQAQRDAWTWDAFLSSAKKLTSGEGASKVYGFASSSAPWFVFMRIWQNGGRVWNEDKTASMLNEPAAYEAIQWYFDLNLKHKVAPSLLEPPSGLFQGGKVAMIDQGPAGRGAFMDLPFTFELAPMPKKVAATSWAGGGSLALPVGQKTPQAAFDFISFFFSDEGVSILLRNGGPGTAIVDGMKSPDFLYSPPTNPQVWIDNLATAKPVPYIIRNTEFLNIFDEQLDLVGSGQQTAREATAKMKPLLDELAR